MYFSKKNLSTLKIDANFDVFELKMMWQAKKGRVYEINRLIKERVGKVKDGDRGDVSRGSNPAHRDNSCG